MKFKSFKIAMKSQIPRQIEMEIKPEVFVVNSSKKILKITSSNISQNIEVHDILDFDYKFSDTLLISSSDLFSGDYNIEIIDYEVPSDAAFIVELFEVNDKYLKTKKCLLNIYKITNNGIKKINAKIFESKKSALESVRKLLDF